jgi:hypothetical protein
MLRRCFRIRRASDVFPISPDVQRTRCIIPWFLLHREALAVHLFTQPLLSEAARCVPYGIPTPPVPARKRMSSISVNHTSSSHLIGMLGKPWRGFVHWHLFPIVGDRRSYQLDLSSAWMLDAKLR